MAAFKIAEGYVRVFLRDPTPAEIERTRRKLEKELAKADTKVAGAKSGQNFTDGFNESLNKADTAPAGAKSGKRFADGFAGSLNKADTKKAGFKSGKRFADGFTDAVKPLDGLITRLVQGSLLATVLGGPSQVLAALGGAAVAAGSAVTSALPAFAALPASLLAIGQGAGVAILGFKGATSQMATLVEAEGEVAEAVRDHGKGSKEAADAQLRYNAILKQTPPQVRAWGEQLGDTLEVLTDVNKQFGAKLVVGWGGELKALTNSLLPLFRAEGLRTAGVLNQLGISAARMVRDPAFRSDLQVILRSNTGVMKTFGQAGLAAVPILTDLLVTVQPLTNRFAEWTREVAGSTAEFIHHKRETGELAQFWDRAGDSAARWGSILADVGVALKNVFVQGASNGRDLLGVIDRNAQRFREWTESFEGQQAIGDWFARGEKLGRSLLGLLETMHAEFNGIAATDLSVVIDEISERLVPAMAEFRSEVDATGTLVDLVDAAASFVSVLSAGAGVLGIVASTLKSIAGGIDWLTDNVPGATNVLRTFFAVLAVNKIATMLGFTAAARGMGSALERLGGVGAPGSRGVTAVSAAANSGAGGVGKFGRAVSGVGTAMGLLPIAGVAVASALAVASQNSDRARQHVDALASGWEGLALSTHMAGTTGEQAAQQLGELERKQRTAAQTTHEFDGELINQIYALKLAKEAAKDRADELGPMGLAQQRVTDEERRYLEILDRYKPGSDEAKAAADRLGEAKADLTKRERELAEATETTTDKMLDQVQATNDLLGATSSYHRSVRETGDSIDALTQAQQALQAARDKYGATSPQAVAAQRAVDEATDDLRDSFRGQAEAVKALVTEQRGADAGAIAYREELSRLASKLGPNDPLRKELLATIGALNDLADPRTVKIGSDVLGAVTGVKTTRSWLDLVPKSKTTTLGANSGPAIFGIGKVREHMARLKNRTLYVDVHARVHGGSVLVSGAASGAVKVLGSGGVVQAMSGGVAALVAERGSDEAVIPLDSRGARYLREAMAPLFAQQASPVPAGGGQPGGVTIHNLTVTVPARDIAELRHVTEFFGRLPQVVRQYSGATTRAGG